MMWIYIATQKSIMRKLRFVAVLDLILETNFNLLTVHVFFSYIKVVLIPLNWLYLYGCCLQQRDQYNCFKVVSKFRWIWIFLFRKCKDLITFVVLTGNGLILKYLVRITQFDRVPSRGIFLTVADIKEPVWPLF